MANSDERKQRIMDHVKRTTKLSNEVSPAEKEQRKQRIMEHIKRTRN
ncbi:hypothetical protein QPK87_00765 [Kamptonema cortianum]|uniref:Uncharacterized protein n=1 Tax=Geitlerinema calcuttense NRMC-F 0142 TaxID=2922238 RepID=A0ABT7LYQ6_9CYAN|nr:hypothetical protein [Geitlerinema calcuttense]MDK3155120.1 hypothetical protein [Kamptonema cortianum]MDL5057138.1 hypothetical protein [Geitlerinema calcuttense NRMC-F 0142]